jgi:hypothetical protein
MFCENCKIAHTGDYGSGRFCCAKCARGYSTKSNRSEINAKVSATLKAKPDGGATHLQLPTIRNKAKKAAAKYHEIKKIELDNLPFEKLSVYQMRNRILAEQNNKCNRCGLDRWQNEILVLEFEHKDGNNKNNNRDNLECICPNCHSLTPTWRGRNVANKKNISDEEMIEMLIKTRSLHRTLISFGMTPKGGNYKRVKRLVEENNIEIDSSIYTRSVLQTIIRERKQELLDLRNSGSSFEKIAEVMGIHIATVKMAYYRVRDSA